MKYSEKNKPMVCMMTQSTCYKGTGKMQVKGVLWHSTGANNPTLKRYVQPDDNAANKDAMIRLIGKNAYGNDWNHTKVQAGLNAWIGKLADGSVAAVQTMPWDFKPWGCGSSSKGSCNNGWIQFEICEDGLNDATYFAKVYQEACELTAYLCKMFGINPTTLKEHFKQNFGCPVYSYAKNRRMFRAAELMTASDMRIIDIAEEAGYSNASKFSSAFREVMGVNPKYYQMEHKKLRTRQSRFISENFAY